MDHLSASQLREILDASAALAPVHRARIAAAVADRSFGLCARCGDDLLFGQLLARPGVALCATCADDLASTQAGRRIGVCGIKP